MSNPQLELLTNQSDLDSVTLEYIEGFRRKPWEENGEFEPTIAYILGEMARPNFIGFLKFVEGELAAFGWGYQEDIVTLAGHKYDTEGMQTSVAKVVCQVAPTGVVNYVSEVVTVEKFEGQGFGKTIVNELRESGGKLPTLLRTHTNSIGMNRICRKLGFQKLPITDTELPRVLYIRPNK